MGRSSSKEVFRGIERPDQHLSRSRSSSHSIPLPKRLRLNENSNERECESFQGSSDESSSYRGTSLDRNLSGDLPQDLSQDLSLELPSVESAYIPIDNDEKAIEDYEVMRASQRRIEDPDQRQPNSPFWIKGRGSIYLDAFNLALDTVLEDESYLFDENELTAFSIWKHLDYESQYL
jgi:fanconi-associated nuclease 1